MNRRRILSRGGLALLALALAPAALAETPDARAAFAAGAQAFHNTNFPVAHSHFLAAADAAPTAKLDPAAAFYNAALAAYGAGDFKGAADAFARAASGADLDLQARAFYNRGNALFHQATAADNAPALAARSTQELATASATIGEAIQMFASAMALNPRDLDAKANYELAVLKQQELQQQQQQQQQQNQQDKQDQQDQQDQPQPPDQPNPQDDSQQPQPEDQKDQQQDQPQAAPDQAEAAAEDQPEPAAAEKSADTMTPEEAAMLLDAMKAQEQQQRDQLHPFLGRPEPVEKDW